MLPFSSRFLISDFLLTSELMSIGAYVYHLMILFIWQNNSRIIFAFVIQMLNIRDVCQLCQNFGRFFSNNIFFICLSDICDRVTNCKTWVNFVTWFFYTTDIRHEGLPNFLLIWNYFTSWLIPNNQLMKWINNLV